MSLARNLMIRKKLPSPEGDACLIGENRGISRSNEAEKAVTEIIPRFKIIYLQIIDLGSLNFKALPFPQNDAQLQQSMAFFKGGKTYRD
ncbi:hypothetical protein CDAR_208481 [Caerostris darwini]|uniref:Uncharacterized protein n=1 Tax=Caerostris darwini TaxID=1538125 RepID=A0AAV4W7H4_9ARAC|nr:hypothetical protein CDAR_208481 [Caerostris darwini]